jgi:two-component system, OmpR family, response regulator
MSSPPQRFKVAVIDDDEATLQTAAQLLARSGLEVVTHSAAHSRLVFIAKEKPDLVLLDVNMPLVPGDDVCQLIKEHPHLREIPVVFFSSNDEQTLRRMVRETGAAGYITKSEMAFGGLGAKVARFLPARQPVPSSDGSC